MAPLAMNWLRWAAARCGSSMVQNAWPAMFVGCSRAAARSAARLDAQGQAHAGGEHAGSVELDE